MATTPADLNQLIAAIREQRTVVRRAAIELARDNRRPPVDKLAVDVLGTALTPGEALLNASEGLASICPGLHHTTATITGDFDPDFVELIDTVGERRAQALTAAR